MNATKNDHLGLGFGCLYREPQAVAGDIGYILNLGALIVVCQNDRVTLPGEGANPLSKGFYVVLRILFFNGNDEFYGTKWQASRYCQ